MQPPYITAWSGEVGHVVRPEPLLSGTLALFCRSGSPGEGSPVWGRISEERQRQVALERRCQVCAGKLGAFGYAVAMPIEPIGRPWVLPIRTDEPLVCDGCLPKAVVCPRIRQAYRERSLYIVAVTDYRTAAHILEPWPAPQDEVELAVNAALAGVTAPVIGLVELLIEHGQVLEQPRLDKLMTQVPG